MRATYIITIRNTHGKTVVRTVDADDSTIEDIAMRLEGLREDGRFVEDFTIQGQNLPPRIAPGGVLREVIASFDVYSVDIGNLWDRASRNRDDYFRRNALRSIITK